MARDFVISIPEYENIQRKGLVISFQIFKELNIFLSTTLQPKSLRISEKGSAKVIIPFTLTRTNKYFLLNVLPEK
jgi:hypothetical protein